MKLMKGISFLVLVLLITGCATTSSTSDAPLPPRAKLTSYPSPEDSERVARIYYDMLSKRPIASEDQKFWSENAGKTITGQYETANIMFVGKKYKLAKQMLQLPADQGFGLAQYKCGMANALSKGKLDETYAYLYLASKSSLPDASVPAKKALEAIEKIISEKEKTRGKALAENIESAYLPEFETQVFLTESAYFRVLLKNTLEYMKERALDKEEYVKDKKILD